MVKAIDFAVRSSTGGLVRGSIAGDGGNGFLQVGSGEEVSLHLSARSVQGYVRQGNDLVLTLVDGRQIVLSDYFETLSGVENRLYLSSNSEVTEVFLSDGQNGTLYANYGAVDTWSKYSTVDDLRFLDDDIVEAAIITDDNTVGMAPFIPGLLGGLGGAGLGTAAAVVGGAGLIGGLSGGGGHTAATVNGTGGTVEVNGTGSNPSVIINGTGHPGDQVVVIIDGRSQTTTITSGGTWEVTYSGTNLPPDGTYTTQVTVTGEGYGPVVLIGPDYIIDITPPDLSVLGGTESVSHIENLAAYQDGVTINGQGEAGASIQVVIGSFTRTTTVSSSGTWSVTFSQAQIAAGEYSVPVTITSADAMGNRTVLTETLVIDTVANQLAFNTVAGDNMINGSEAGGAVTVTGVSNPGAVITLTIDGVSQQVTTGSGGTWSITYPAGTFAAGEYDRTITATTTDIAGNSTTTTHAIRIDTTTSVSFSTDLLTADNVINNAEAGQGVYLTGTTTADAASVMVSWNGFTLPASVLNGQWDVRFPSSTITNTSGTSVATVVTTDLAGNTSSATRSITVDRGTYANFNSGLLGGDSVVSGAEANAGVVLSGNAEAGSQVTIEFQGLTRVVTATASNTWSTSFTSAQITRGTYVDTARVTAVDAAGNTDTSTLSVTVDTEVRDFARSTLSTGADNVLNQAEAAQGLTVTGTVEAGSSVVLSLGAKGPYTATVTNGTWTVTIPAGDIPAGEGTATLTATATDRYGNTSAPYSEVVNIDRIVSSFSPSWSLGAIGGDGVLNANEVAAGLTLTGTSEVGSTVVVQLSNGSSETVVVGSAGTWSASFAGSRLPAGEETMTVNVTATDRAGNVSSFSDTVGIDTLAPGAPDIEGFSKFGTNLERIVAVTSGHDYEFFRVDATGPSTEITGTSSAYRGSTVSTEYEFNGVVPDGSYLVVNAHDAAGNDSSTLMIVNNTSSSAVNLGRAGLADFDFNSIDLSYAPSATMTINRTNLVSLTGQDNSMLVKGAGDDTVTLVNATPTGQHTFEGEVYNIYTLGGAGATIMVDEDIHTVI